MSNTNILNISWGGILSENNKADVRHHNNEVFFYSTINSESINLLINAINSVLEKQIEKQKSLLNEDNNCCKVILYIDSAGGTIKDCFKFIDYINILKKNNKIHLTTVCTGCVASAATLIALIGDIRYITELSTYMIHELSCASVGHYTHVASQMKFINSLHENIINLYQKYIPELSREVISSLLLAETWLSALECEKMGIAKII
jgi:ATP-dependent protease ClpP protease subunit